MKKNKEQRKMSKRELLVMFREWLKADLVKAGYIFHYIEKQNDAFARGWRSAMHSVISKIEENE